MNISRMRKVSDMSFIDFINMAQDSNMSLIHAFIHGIEIKRL
jgi:hypothetical protein